MLLDQLFGQPLSKVLKIIRKDGKMKSIWVPIERSEEQGNIKERAGR